MDFRQEIGKAVKKVLKKDIELEVPPSSDMGDFALPCFSLAKEFKKSPVEISRELLRKFADIKGIEKVESRGPYINFFVDKNAFMRQVLSDIHEEKDEYGSANIGKGKTVVIEYSSPNIAKPFGIAHIRSTMIGNSLYKIHKKLGYKAIRVNHLGDWGTQFGKLIVAYKKWGDKKKLAHDPLSHLLDIYIKFHEEAEINPKLEDEARAWFKKLEDEDKEAVELWDLFKVVSLAEFKRYYEKLTVEFDFYQGESYYADKIKDTIKEVQSKIKTKMDQGALIVDLKEYEMPPLLLLKSDGASTYHTRDLAAALFRLKKFKPEKLLYVVGSPQTLHFRQLFKTLAMMKNDPEKLVHIPFGNMTFEGEMMSTREGNFILLEEVLDKAIELALKKINEKNPDLKYKKEIAEEVGIGAVIFSDLMNDRVRDSDFTWEKALDFEGESAPYLQYTHARICSVLRKSKQKVNDKIKIDVLENEKGLIRQLNTFPETIVQAHQNYKPHVIARYLLDLAQLFNSYYQNYQILNQTKEITSARLLVADSVRQVLKNGLDLLGIAAPEEM